jgi:hypothetical protein
MISQVPRKPAGDTKASPALKVRCEPSSPVTHDNTRQKITELVFRKDDAPSSGLGFPYAGFEAAVGALKQVGRCLGWIAGEDALSLRAVALRLRERILEADNLIYGFRGRTDRFFVFNPHLLSPSLVCAVAASWSFWSGCGVQQGSTPS